MELHPSRPCQNRIPWWIFFPKNAASALIPSRLIDLLPSLHEFNSTTSSQHAGQTCLTRQAVLEWGGCHGGPLIYTPAPGTGAKASQMAVAQLKSKYELLAAKCVPWISVLRKFWYTKKSAAAKAITAAIIEVEGGPDQLIDVRSVSETLEENLVGQKLVRHVSDLMGFQWFQLYTVWVFPKMLGFPKSPPLLMIIFSRKTNGCWGNPPF